MKKDQHGKEDMTSGRDNSQTLPRETEETVHLQDSAKTQMAVLNALPSQIALLNIKGVILAVNEAWRRFATANVLQGEDFFVGQNYLSVCENTHGDCAEELQVVANGIRSVLAGQQEEFSLECPCHSPTEKCWFRLIVTPLRDQRISGAVVTHLNITEQKLAEESLQKSQALLRMAGEAARMGGWSLELPDYQLTWSDEICRIYELPAGSVPTVEQAIEFYAPEYREKVARHVKLCALEGIPFDFEVELITAKQRRIWVRAIGEAEKDENNQILRIRGAFQDISQQKAAEEAARSAGDRILETLESITDGFFTLDREWRFTYVNAVAEKLLDRDRSTLLGRSIWAAYPPVLGTIFEREYRRAIEENCTVTFEEYYPPLDMWIEVKAYPSAEALAVYFRDVSERRNTLAALQASESKFRQLADSNILGIMTWDASGNICDANDAFLQMFGYSRDDLQDGNIDWREMTPPEFLERDEQALEEVSATGRCTPYEKEYFHKDGHRVAIMLGAAALDGAKDRGICYVVDISAQNASEAKVRASEASLVHAQSIARIGNWDWDIRADKLYWSAQVFRLFGLDPSETMVEYQTFLKGVHPEDREWVDEVVQASLAGGPYDIQHRVLHPDGTSHWVHEQGEVIRDAEGVALSMTGTVQDIHELKLAEIEITRTNRALKLLSGCNAALIHAEDETILLKDICQLAVETGGYQMAWVGYAMDDARKSILAMAHAGVEDGYLNEISITWDETNDSSKGPGGKTILSGKAVICGDLLEEPNFQWLDAAQRRNYRAVICLPLRDKQRTFGLLGLHSAETIVTNTEELRLLQEMADDLAFGILNLRERHARRSMQTAMITVASAVTATTGQEFFEQLAGKMAQAVGAQAGFVAELVPSESLKARTIIAVVDGQPAHNFEYDLVDTPCENLATSDTCVISAGVSEQFPLSPGLAKLGAQGYVGRCLDRSDGKFLGLLFVLFREPLQDPDFVVAMLQIFAARAAAELERQETDTRLREQAELLDKARDAIFVRRLDHKIHYWNLGAERLYGWTAEEAIGRDIRELIYRDADALDIAFEKLMSSGESVREIEHVTKTGSVVIVERRCSLVTDEKENPKSILSINTDITERKKIEEQYLRAQRMESIGTLAGGIAHDLNNVLAPIMMSIDLLKVDEKSDERLSILSIIEGSAKRGADMVKQVLSFARGVEGLQTEVRIRPLIEEVQKVVHDTFRKNIELRSKIAPDLWLVRGDPTQLHQVLINLCVNARDAMPDGGTLTLTADNLILDEQYSGMNIEAKPGHHVCIHVEDSGEGMPPSVIERIFEPFFTTKELGKGTGMGLSTSIAIIKSHGGFIRVYSEVGMGTRFHVYLPAYIGTDDEENHPVIIELPRGNGELVLVVDDEVAVREITRQTLETFGYRVLLATDGVDATSIYAQRRQEIALVLTDMMMPLMDGPTMIKVLLKLDPDVRIIAASGLNANGMVAKAHSNGIRHFIPKPYTAETLLKTVREALEA